MPQDAKAKHWAFTINNPTIHLDWATLSDHASFLIYQLEEAATPHYQGYIVFKNPIRLTAIKKLAGLETAHLEKCKGTPDQNVAYCTKEDTRKEGPWSYGDQPTSAGTRTDLASACATLKEHGIKRVAEEHPTSFVKYYRGFEQLAKKINPPIQTFRSLLHFNYGILDLSKAVLLYGDSGTGKTEFALAHFQSPLLVRHLDALASFDSGVHDGIVFDDMSFLHFPPEARIHLVDMDRDSEIHIRYVTGLIPAGTKRIFTHNTGDVFYGDEDKYKLKEAQLEAIQRRLLLIGPIKNKLY